MNALDVAFWACALVAIAGLTGLVAVSLYAWQPSWASVVRDGSASAPRLVARHFGRTYRSGWWDRWALALR